MAKTACLPSVVAGTGHLATTGPTCLGGGAGRSAERRFAVVFCAMSTAGHSQPRRHPAGSVATGVVSLLMDLGHADEVRRLGEEGDWGCASAWASAAVERGEFDEALAMLTPFADTGWWPSVVARDRVVADAAESLESPESTETSELTEPAETIAPAPSPDTDDSAAVLARAGRVTEAVDFLHAAALREGGFPHQALPALVGMTAEYAEYGLHERVLAIIDDVASKTDGMTVGLLERRAAVLALRGDTEQAFAELSEADGDAPWLTELQLARILAGVGLYEEVVTRLAAFDDSCFLLAKASALLRLGRVAEAIEVGRGPRLS